MPADAADVPAATGTPRRRRSLHVAVLAAAQALLLVATFPLPGFGAKGWHHLASLGVVIALAVAFRRRLTSRAFLAFGVLATTVLATASGFYLLYWKEGIRVDGYQDWGVFWHVAWSWAAALFFFQHTWVNRVAYGHFLRRSLRWATPAVLHLGAYALLVAALLVTWGPAKGAFTNGNYVPLSFAAWLAAVVPAYALWLGLRRRPATAQRHFRGHVDVALVPIAALAVISGLPLLYLDPQLDGWGLKYASKVWHVWPSVAFAVLVFAHSLQAWSTMRAHWRKLAQARARTQEAA